MHLGRWCSPGIRHTQVLLSECQMKDDSSLQRMRFHLSRVQWRRALHHSSQRLALRMDFRLVCGCSGMETYFMKLPTNSSVSVDIASRGCLEISSECSSRAEIWRTDLLERCHRHMTMPLWKSLSSSVRPFYCQCLSMEIAQQCAWFIYFFTAVGNSCGWNSLIY